MKHLLLALPLGLVLAPAYGQHMEYSARGTVGFAKFAGNGVASTTTVNDANNVPNAESSRAVNPYGNTYGTGGGLSVRVQRVEKFNVITAFDLGYDLMQTRLGVTAIRYNSIVPPDYGFNRAGSGVVRLFSHAVTAFGGVGYRLGGEGHALALDALVGPELAYLVAAHENGDGTNSSGTAWHTDLSRTPNTHFDFRLRGDLSIWRKRVGVVASYSYGFSNYQPATSGVSSPDASIRLARVGLGYRLK
ncbi:MAG: hypothetical protein EOO36_17490 [Cytophagaceae bacterium]|nr:MAG: hypothetical protein EOO36_17490 [Cytophagaceae bacterium]